MYLPLEKALLILRLLVEGNSIRSTERITGVEKKTILSLLVLAGNKCERLLDEKLQNLSVRDVQADEMWGFVGMKERRSGGSVATRIRLAMPTRSSLSNGTLN
jgi:hypothetical protein